MIQSWFKMQARGNDAANIDILSDIGDWGVSAADFSQSLKALGSPRKLNITIASNGGDVSTGFAIYNMLAGHSAHKTVTISGLAASMASVVSLAGDEILMPSNSMIMVHNPFGFAAGGFKEIHSFGDALEKMRAAIGNVYAKRTGLPLDDVFQYMDSETWFSAEEAVTLGFADRVIEPQQMAASFNTQRFRNVPEKIRAADANYQPRTLDEIRVCAFEKFNQRRA